MDARTQHVGSILHAFASARRPAVIVAFSLALALGFAAGPAAALARTETVGVGMQRSTHESMTSSYASAKLGSATGTSLHSTSSDRDLAGVTVAGEIDAGEFAGTGGVASGSNDFTGASTDWAGEDSAVSGEGGAAWVDAAASTAYEEPVYEGPAYDGDAAGDFGNYDEPTYEEPAYDWYTVQASAYSVATNGGTTTASGIPLDDCALTVASPWVALGAVVEIECGGVTVQAVVTDRGPYVGGRDLDLSVGVIQALGFASTDDWGVRTVTYRVL